MIWKEKAFEELFCIPTKNGLTKPSRIRGEGSKFINMGELFAYDRICDPTMELVPLSDREKVSHKIEENDLLFARQSLIAAGAGKCSIVKQVDELTVFDSHIIRVRLNQTVANPNFYFYYFKSPITNIRSLVQQGVQAGIRASDLKKLDVHVPELNVQNRIASILTDYDDLIENNQKRINLLEEASKHLYTEWFVNFKFPGCENTPINEETGLPEGWKEDIIGNTLAKVKRPGKLKKGEYLKEGEFPVIDQGNDVIGGYSNNEELVISSKLPMVVFGDHTRRVKFIDFPFICGADGTQLLYPKNEKLLPAYYYLAINNIDLSNYAYARHFKFLKVKKILIPSNITLDSFNAFVYPLLKQCTKLRSYNSKLNEARDLLLPRLMNRTIEV